MSALRRPLLVLVSLVALAGAARADEGMWLLNELPTEAIQKATGVTPDAAFVERVQKGALRLANGCSASFVGKAGLVMTNHHCVRSCLEELSVGGKDLLNKPFVAKTERDELRCTRFELNQLQKITNVTDTVLKATAGKEGAAFQAALKAEKARLESACSNGDVTRRCEVISLFDGARFHLYEQRRFQDVRLVMAPEFPSPSCGSTKTACPSRRPMPSPSPTRPRRMATRSSSWATPVAPSARAPSLSSSSSVTWRCRGRSCASPSCGGASTSG
jgi:hypothetical protein